MPKTPTGHERPADVVSNAVRVMQIATGEVEEFAQIEQAESPAAILGRSGGRARATALSERRRSEIAAHAARKRWEKKKQQ